MGRNYLLFGLCFILLHSPRGTTPTSSPRSSISLDHPRLATRTDLLHLPPDLATAPPSSHPPSQMTARLLSSDPTLESRDLSIPSGHRRVSPPLPETCPHRLATEECHCLFQRACPSGGPLLNSTVTARQLSLLNECSFFSFSFMAVSQSNR